MVSTESREIFPIKTSCDKSLYGIFEVWSRILSIPEILNVFWFSFLSWYVIIEVDKDKRDNDEELILSWCCSVSRLCAGTHDWVLFQRILCEEFDDYFQHIIVMFGYLQILTDTSFFKHAAIFTLFFLIFSYSLS